MHRSLWVPGSLLGLTLAAFVSPGSETRSLKRLSDFREDIRRHLEGGRP